MAGSTGVRETTRYEEVASSRPVRLHAVYLTIKCLTGWAVESRRILELLLEVSANSALRVQPV